ncbi:MAG: proline dehydrogenase family protein [Nitrospiraceae bacterium]
MVDPLTLEPRIRAIGAQLAELSAGHSPALFDSRWWSQTTINLAMKDPMFKAQLFRFIDVLPALKQDAQVIHMAREYFGEMGEQIFGLQWGLKALSATGLGAALSGKTIRHQVQQMAKTFIAGSTIADAVPVLERLWKEKRGYSVDLLGEATVGEREADLYQEQCATAAKELSAASAAWPSTSLLERDHMGALPRAQLSLKLSALCSQLDPADPEGSYRAVAGRLRSLLDVVCSLPASIVFDMEQAETKDLVLFIFRKVFSEEPYRSYPYAGLALQAYRRDAHTDVESMCAWARQRQAPVTIRLVKGAYWDSDTIRYRQRGWPVPLFEHKAETDANYEILVRLVLQHSDVIRPAFGTHNLRSLAVVEAMAEALGVNPEVWEYQMIFGMAEPFQTAIAKLGRRLRIYTPVGELLPGMAYLVRRLLENTSNESFLRKEYVESQSLTQLMMPPSGSHQVSNSSVARSTETFPDGPDEFQNEPHSDFSQSVARQSMQDAIHGVRKQLGLVLPEEQVHASGAELITRNPDAPEQIIGRARAYTPSDVVSLNQMSLKRFLEWSVTSVESRVTILRQASGLMRRRRYELAAWEIFEQGKPWREADADVAEAIDFLNFYADEMLRIGVPQRLGHAPGELNHRLVGPRGVTAVIAPWNFPLAIPAGMVSAALVTGNTVLFKPSERALVMGHLLVEILVEAGLPRGVLQLVPGGPEIGQALVTAPVVATIAFTGSRDVGLSILDAAGVRASGQSYVKKVIAEMGGKNAIIVDDTADVDEAVIGVVTSFTGYSGQKCSACSRVIVHADVYDTFVRRLADAVMSLRIGSPEDPGTQVGPLIDERAEKRVREYVRIGKEEGRILVERQVNQPGYFVGPIVFIDVESSHRLAQEEIFGPVLSVMKAKTCEEAICLANDTIYALTGGIYSRSPANIELARKRFDVGNLYINRPITGALVGRQPFGGHRLSGVGAKAGGTDYLWQFLVTRVVSEQTIRRGFAPAE